MHFIGCDVSKATLDLAGFIPSIQRWTRPYKVNNNHRGWRRLLDWTEQHCQAPRDQIVVVMEATCVYHLKAAASLVAEGLRVIIANPGRSADYAKSQNRTNKSDGLDARDLQRYGAQLDKPHWYRPDIKEIRQLKILLARLCQLDKDLQREHNRLEKCDFLDDSELLRASLHKQLKLMTRERARVQRLVDQLIKEHDYLRRNQQLMCSIKGIGKVTSQWLLPLLSNRRFISARQVAAFLGLVPCHKQSGTTLHSRGQLSGRGNSNLRARLYMPAVTAITHNRELKTFYEVLLARGKTPKQALTAVMRKLVHLCYGVVKHQTPYQENYAA